MLVADCAIPLPCFKKVWHSSRSVPQRLKLQEVSGPYRADEDAAEKCRFLAVLTRQRGYGQLGMTRVNGSAARLKPRPFKAGFGVP